MPDTVDTTSESGPSRLSAAAAPTSSAAVDAADEGAVGATAGTEGALLTASRSLSYGFQISSLASVADRPSRDGQMRQGSRGQKDCASGVGCCGSRNGVGTRGAGAGSTLWPAKSALTLRMLGSICATTFHTCRTAPPSDSARFSRAPPRLRQATLLDGGAGAGRTRTWLRPKSCATNAWRNCIPIGNHRWVSWERKGAWRTHMGQLGVGQKWRGTVKNYLCANREKGEPRGSVLHFASTLHHSDKNVHKVRNRNHVRNVVRKRGKRE